MWDEHAENDAEFERKHGRAHTSQSGHSAATRKSHYVRPLPDQSYKELINYYHDKITQNPNAAMSLNQIYANAINPSFQSEISDSDMDIEVMFSPHVLKLCIQQESGTLL